MRRILAALLFLPVAALADPVETAVDAHILPGFATLAAEAVALHEVSETTCQPDAPALREAWGTAFDAWVRVSHLRFGPTEAENRAFALAFWPDTRGATPRSLADLIAGADPVVQEAQAFASVSVAARGFYALEYLLFDAEFAAMGDAGYRCTLVRAIARDIAATSAAILTDWQEDYANLLRTPGGNDLYRSREEAAQELFKALATGLQFTSDTRLGRPMGSFDRPRPERAEARRSGRSLRHVILSLEGTEALALILAKDHPEVAAAFEAAYARAFEVAERLDDPVFAGVATPQGRLRVEVLQQAVDAIRGVAAQQLGPRLGVAAGFNALDGD